MPHLLPVTCFATSMSPGAGSSSVFITALLHMSAGTLRQPKENLNTVVLYSHPLSLFQSPCFYLWLSVSDYVSEDASKYVENSGSDGFLSLYKYWAIWQPFLLYL